VTGLGRFVGTNHNPSLLQSFSNRVSIRFSSSGLDLNEGFSLHYISSRKLFLKFGI